MATKSLRILFIALCIILVLWAAAALLRRELSGATVEQQQVHIGQRVLTLLVADEPAEHNHGLSGYQLDKLTTDGMIFVFPAAEERTFWMYKMNFGLDIVWVADGQVVKIEPDVPAPLAGEEPLKMHSAPQAADMVIELPTGGIDKWGIAVGDVVQIDEVR